jgi:hypothetical protein
MTLEWKSNLLVDETFVDVGKVLKNKNNLLVILSDLRLEHGQDTVGGEPMYFHICKACI